MMKGKFEKKKGKRVEYLRFEILKILNITGKLGNTEILLKLHETQLKAIGMKSERLI